MVPRKPQEAGMLHRSGLPHQDSPLRQARKARNWTLERLVEEIDLRTPGGHSGVTPSMVSGWELGRHTTSIGHRAMLCEIFGQRPDVLFAHQDESLVGRRMRLPAGSRPGSLDVLRERSPAV
jgi:transcriptional regulator with XRE-family HTH domain